MKRYTLNYENKLVETENGCLVSADDFDMMKMKLEGEKKILVSEYEVKIKKLEGQIQILEWKFEADQK